MECGHPEASCCTTGSLKAATCTRMKCQGPCVPLSQHVLLSCPPTGLNLPPPVGMGVAMLGHLIHNPLMQVFHRIWSLSSWPCSGSRVGLTMGQYSWNFRPGLSCQGMAVLGAFRGVGSWAGKLGALLHSGAAPSSKKRVRSEGKFGSSPNSLSTSNQTCFLSFSSVCGEALHCHALLLDS